MNLPNFPVNYYNQLLHSSIIPFLPLFVYIHAIAIPLVTSDNPPHWKDKSTKRKSGISMVWRSLHHKEILLSEPGRNTNVGENAFIPELPLYIKDWSTLFCLHWEMKGHCSHVNLWEALHKIYKWPMSFHFAMQTKRVLQSLNLTWKVISHWRRQPYFILANLFWNRVLARCMSWLISFAWVYWSCADRESSLNYKM